MHQDTPAIDLPLVVRNRTYNSDYKIIDDYFQNYLRKYNFITVNDNSKLNRFHLRYHKKEILKIRITPKASNTFEVNIYFIFQNEVKALTHVINGESKYSGYLKQLTLYRLSSLVWSEVDWKLSVYEKNNRITSSGNTVCCYLTKNKTWKAKFHSRDIYLRAEEGDPGQALMVLRERYYDKYKRYSLEDKDQSGEFYDRPPSLAISGFGLKGK